MARERKGKKPHHGHAPQSKSPAVKSRAPASAAAAPAPATAAPEPPPGEFCLAATIGPERYACTRSDARCCQALCANGSRCQREGAWRWDLSRLPGGAALGGYAQGFLKSQGVDVVPAHWARGACCRFCGVHLRTIVTEVVTNYLASAGEYEASAEPIRQVLLAAGLDPALLYWGEWGLTLAGPSLMAAIGYIVASIKAAPNAKD